MQATKRKTVPVVIGLLLALKAAVLVLPDLLRVAPDVVPDVVRVAPDVVRAAPLGVADDAVPVVAQDDWGRITEAALNGADITVDAVGLIAVEDE